MDPQMLHTIGRLRPAQRRVQCAAEVVERPAPAVLVRNPGLLVPQAAVREADRGGALALLEVDLDQLPPGVAVPRPGESQARRRIHLGVLTAPAVLDVLVG